MRYKIISWLGQKLIFAIESLFRRTPVIQMPTPTWATGLCQHTGVILSEFNNLYNKNLREFGSISAEQNRITTGNSWKVFILKAYRRKISENYDLCPKTTRLIESIPEITTAMFSILEPKTHITPHRGPYAGVLRCQIPLIVPKGDLGIRVGETTHLWKIGTPLIFDDTIDHEAWNNTTERRVVLFIDFLRPLPWPLALINRLMIRVIGLSPFVGRAIRASR
ncbi:MAG: hypothetical protein LDLANPLL_01002 [Turneriella sp.]|nr:hypothetical protein [Turneriella sp.]